MSYLLDTCALIWLTNGGKDLSPKARQICGDINYRLHVSAASAWEVALKQVRGKLALESPAANWWKGAISLHRLVELGITGEIAIVSTSLPPIHADPADRLLVATALHYRLAIITPDAAIAKYPGLKTIW